MACKIQYVSKAPPKPAPLSSPYGLIDLHINGKLIQGRPIAWDSSISDHSNQLNAQGGPVVPTKVITMCPDCTAGFELDLYPDGVLSITVECPHCHQPEPVVVVPLPADPFINPFEAGVLNFSEVNLDLIATLNELPADTVGDRMAD